MMTMMMNQRNVHNNNNNNNQSSLAIRACCELFPAQPAGVEAEAAIVTESFCSLEGHTNRITGLSWSLHREGFLVSCSYDWTAQVLAILCKNIL